MFDSLVGIPYLDKGRDRAGCDCWGLVALAFAELAGVELPSYADRYVTGADRQALAALIGGELGDWLPVVSGSERRFDVVLMREGSYPRHIGLVVTPGQLLHVQPGGTSCIERYRGGILANRVVGFYRHQQHA